MTVLPWDRMVRISATRAEMGEAAAADVAAELRRRLAKQVSVRMIFAAAPSQGEMLDALAAAEGVDWSRVEAFHMDEYIGLPEGAKQSFRAWLKEAFFNRVPMGAVHLIDPGADAAVAAKDYAALLAERPIDLVCLGIGMNGHIAFNDPPAMFDDAEDVRVVEMEHRSRVQQVEEGLFASIDAVPTHAITLTIPRLLRAERLFCCVPGSLKEHAVTRALLGPIAPESPASILRTHPGCTIYLDGDSAAGLPELKKR